ncbi:MAG TPA: ATP-dependent sacrificial sulfur transferase LarE [Candidatus Lokiarchaeia archaeon]|nr:ATP-dependent sacrificial sulfur transferase LarE [Candidatus Lokiarchaeia archaeon]
MDNELLEKYMKLREFIQENGKDGVVIAFSGGVDSSTLAAVSHDVLGDKAMAVSGKSSTYPIEELEEAKCIAETIGIEHVVIETHETENETFLSNTENRCYYCKGELLDVLLDIARERGFKAVFEGTNASDLLGHRPGFAAIKERDSVFSPFVEAGITKAEIREIAKELGLEFYDKPASPCLASRIPFGERITSERLERIDAAEKFLKTETGIQELRVRDHGNLARIEVPKDDLAKLMDTEIMDKIVARFKEIGYVYITLDLEGFRSGSMLESLAKEREI